MRRYNYLVGSGPAPPEPPREGAEAAEGGNAPAAGGDDRRLIDVIIGTVCGSHDQASDQVCRRALLASEHSWQRVAFVTPITSTILLLFICVLFCASQFGR